MKYADIKSVMMVNYTEFQKIIEIIRYPQNS